MNFPPLIDELEDAIAHGTPQRRAEILQNITDIFVVGSADYSNTQIDLFDNVFIRLANAIETSARAVLATRLATNSHAPSMISRNLATDDTFSVAGPMLQHSQKLDDKTLVAVARTQTQRHLLAISLRNSICEEVTDILLERGEKPVVLSAANNPKARFSEAGYRTLVERSKGDEELATSVGLRRDIPRLHFMRLLVRASHAVRNKLEAASPAMSSAIEDVVSEVANMILDQTGSARSYSAARAHVEALRAARQLCESDLATFATTEQAEEATVTFAVLCNLPIETVERAMGQDRAETILVLAKASGISWPTVKAILRMRAGVRGISPGEIEQAHEAFSRLKPAIARQVIEFQSKRSRGARLHQHIARPGSKVPEVSGRVASCLRP
ncbi:MAG: DUF2336 domain-containing protein [Pseudolabrys sp.]|nr:DUF2336 domain-containing protein [Pseudolabrys sp.]MDP2295131.1 DUF2336 domain-containing protein [Pseudolabrys sp.]